MATYYTLLTKIGQASIANAVALNQKVNLTYMAVGDGNGNPTMPNENQTTLVREKYRATINQLTVDPDNPNYLVAELIVPTTVGGWSIYEVGVFDDQNQLIAVANFPATYKPELAEGSGRDLIVRIIIQVSNTSVVTLKIDPAITLASQAWVAANYVKKVTVAGGTTGQVLVKKSNANEDFQWVDPTAAVDVNVFSREETQTVATGQTILNLAQLTTDGAAIYIEGIRLRDDQFTVNSPTRLTLATSYPAGTKVTIVQNEETSRLAFMLKANNLSDLTDKGAARTNLGVVAASLTEPGLVRLTSSRVSGAEDIAATANAVAQNYTDIKVLQVKAQDHDNDITELQNKTQDATTLNKGIVALSDDRNDRSEAASLVAASARAAADNYYDIKTIFGQIGNKGRNIGVMYTNAQAMSIFVYVSGIASEGGVFLSAVVNGVNFTGSQCTNIVGQRVCISFMVPAGATYIVAISGGTLSESVWVEVDKK